MKVFILASDKKHLSGSAIIVNSLVTSQGVSCRLLENTYCSSENGTFNTSEILPLIQNVNRVALT